MPVPVIECQPLPHSNSMYGHCMTTDLRAWEKEHADRVVDSVNALRSGRGLTVKALAAKLEELGWKISVDTLNGILSSRKRSAFTVGELLIFARALDVPPLYLVLGLPSTDGLPRSGFVTEGDANTTGAYLWFTDRSFYPFSRSYSLGLLPDLAEKLDLADWHNALWLAAPDDQDLASRLNMSLNDVSTTYHTWMAVSVAVVPHLPPPDLPAALRFLLDSDPDLQAPLEGFSSERRIEEARLYWEREEQLERQRTESERLLDGRSG